MSDKTKIFEFNTEGNSSLFTPVQEVSETIEETLEEVVEESIEEDTKVEDTVEDTTEDSVEEVQDTSNTEETEEEVDAIKKDSSHKEELARYAASLFKEDGYELFKEGEEPEDLSIADVGERYKNLLREELEPQIEQEVMQELASQGINEQALLYAKLIQTGTNPTTLTNAHKYSTYSNVSDSAEEDIKIDIIKARLIDKGYDEKHINSIVESIEVEETLEDEFKSAKKYFKDSYKEVIQEEEKTHKARQAEQQRLTQEREKKVYDSIKSKKVGNFSLSNNQARELKTAIEKSDRIVESGDVKYKATAFQEFLHKFQSNIDLQLELFARNMFGQDIIESTKNEAKKDFEEKLLETLAKKGSKEETDTKKVKKQDKPQFKKTRIF